MSFFDRMIADPLGALRVFKEGGNPYHDLLGRFTTHGSSSTTAGKGTPSVTTKTKPEWMGVPATFSLDKNARVSQWVKQNQYRLQVQIDEFKRQLGDRSVQRGISDIYVMQPKEAKSYPGIWGIYGFGSEKIGLIRNCANDVMVSCNQGVAKTMDRYMSMGVLTHEAIHSVNAGVWMDSDHAKAIEEGTTEILTRKYIKHFSTMLGVDLPDEHHPDKPLFTTMDPPGGASAYNPAEDIHANIVPQIPSSYRTYVARFAHVAGALMHPLGHNEQPHRINDQALTDRISSLALEVKKTHGPDRYMVLSRLAHDAHGYDPTPESQAGVKSSLENFMAYGTTGGNGIGDDNISRAVRDSVVRFGKKKGGS